MLGTALGIGSGLLGAGQSYMNNKRGDSASKRADGYTQQAIGEMGKITDRLDAFQPTIDKFAKGGQDSFDRYQSMFGSLESSVNDYYQNLDPDQYAAQGNQNAQQSYQNTMRQVNDQLASQGIQNSGISSQLGYDYGNQMAQTKAQNMMNAPQQVAEQQSQWLQYGNNRQDNAYNQMSQGIQAQSGLNNQYTDAYNNMASLYGNQAKGANAQAQGYYNQGNQAMQQGMSGLGQGLTGGFDGAGNSLGNMFSSLGGMFGGNNNSGGQSMRPQQPNYSNKQLFSGNF